MGVELAGLTVCVFDPHFDHEELDQGAGRHAGENHQP